MYVASPSVTRRCTLVTCAIRRANSTIASSAPAATPIARLFVATTTTTVVTITRVSDQGIRFRVAGRTLWKSTVETATTIITAASAAIGIASMRSESTVTRISSITPAKKVDSRVRARPSFTLTTVCPIMAQPAMPPQQPARMFATPSAQDSRLLWERVSVMSSTSLAVSRVSIRPTKATLRAVGRIRRRVSRSSGTSNGVIPGSPPETSPWSPTVGTERCANIAIAVTSTIATSGAGTALVNRGSSSTTSRVSANSG